MCSDDEAAGGGAWPFAENFHEFNDDDHEWPRLDMGFAAPCQLVLPHPEPAPQPHPQPPLQRDKQADKWSAAQAVSDAISRAAAKKAAERPSPHPLAKDLPPPLPPPVPPPQTLKRKKRAHDDEEEEKAAPFGLNAMNRLGQLLQGGDSHGPVVTIKASEPFGYYGYSMCGKYALFLHGSLRPICQRFKRSIDRDNKCDPCLSRVWTFATEADPRVPLTARENEKLNDLTMQSQWCGYIDGDKHKFVFVAHSEYQFYIFLSDAPRPERLVLSFDK